MREALFSILESRGRIAGGVVLDVYAGTGALAIEALSRGAARAVLVESDRHALAAIRRNLADLDLGGSAEVVATGAERFLRAGSTARSGVGFTLVLADPPWAHVGAAAALLGEVAQADASGGLLATGACVVLEHASRDGPPDIPGLAREDTRAWGDTAISFYGQAGL